VISARICTLSRGDVFAKEEFAMRKHLDAGFTLIELLIVVAVIGIIAAIAIPGLLRARLSGNEASAVGSLRTIVSAQQTYLSSCGNGYYASTLPILGDAPVGSVPFVSPDLSAGLTVDKSGYRIMMAEGSEATTAVNPGCNALGVAADLYTSYYATANPQSVNVTGSRFFYTNSLATLYQADTNVLNGATVGNAAPAAGVPIQ
jgi:prepilin-type N-terminal cleavage/methylation domain-containing protein